MPSGVPNEPCTRFWATRLSGERISARHAVQVSLLFPVEE